MKKPPIFMTSVPKYIRNNLSGNLNVKSLSKSFMISQPVLQKEFKKKFNLTVHQYIMVKRMEKAYRLVKKTDKPIKAIFELVGFKSLSTFTHQFTKMHKILPSELRRMNRTNTRGSGNT